MKRLHLLRLLPILVLLSLISIQPRNIGLAAEPPPLRQVEPVILRAGETDKPSWVPPPDSFFEARVQSAVISVTFSANFPAEARTAFQQAVDIWATQISSPVEIEIVADWEPLGPGVLGAAGPTFLLRDFSGAPVANTWYPIALANKLAGYDLDPDSDVEAVFNSNFSSWYFGTDGNPASGEFDFVSVVLHEIGHGLGFVGSMDVSNGGQGSWGGGSGWPFIYDRFAVNGDGQQLLNTDLFPNPSLALGDQLVSDNLFFDGSNAVAAAGGSLSRLYAPDPWESGSSYSHLDEGAYPAGSVNALMTPILNSDEANHNPGPITLGMFQDMGWNTSSPANTSPDAADDTAATDEDVSVTIDVLGNDSDPDGDPLTVDSVSQPANGTVVNNGDGTVTYTPAENFNGVDTFTYTLSDGRGGTDTATVTVTVNAVNDPPDAVDDAVATEVDTAVTVGVLSNDSDPDGDPLTVDSVSQPANGTVVNNGDGTVTYTPDDGFEGTDSFTYTTSDSRGEADTATVTVTVTTLSTTGIDLVQGWNLISLPFTPVESDSGTTLNRTGEPGTNVARASARTHGEQPTQPWSVFGVVTIDGQPAPEGTQVEARNPTSGAVCGQTQVRPLTGGVNYTMDIDPVTVNPDCFANGDAVQFLVEVVGAGLRQAQQNPPDQMFQSGDVSQIDLSVVSAVALTELLSSIEGNYDRVYAFEGCDSADSWKLYDPNVPPFVNDLDNIDITKGLWIKMNTADTLTVLGTATTGIEIPLCAGWNLIGYPSTQNRPVLDVLAPIDGQYERVYTFDASDPGDPWKLFDLSVPGFVNDLTEFTPEFGYWIRVTEDTVLRVGD